MKFWGRAIGVIGTLNTAGANDTVDKPEKILPEGFGFAVPQVTLPNGQVIAFQTHTDFFIGRPPVSPQALKIQVCIICPNFRS